MSLQYLFYTNEGDEPTFSKDSTRPNLPLPKLSESLDRYYEALKPFGNAVELENSRKILDEFKNGVGQKLQEILEEKAKTHKNWLESWWDEYAYLINRTPIYPFVAMAKPFMLEAIGRKPTESNRLINFACHIRAAIELWHLFRTEKFKQTNPDGTIYTNHFYRQIYNTVREPGKVIDKIQCYFKTVSEGNASSNVVLIANGRIFIINGMTENGSIINEKKILMQLKQITDLINNHGSDYPIPILTCDDRTKWAQNRQYLIDLSKKNKENLKLIEESICVMSLDSNSPEDMSELCTMSVCGDLHSRWADKSIGSVGFQNGKMANIGEHCCYDGSYSIMVAMFLMLYAKEMHQPDSNEFEYVEMPTELTFDLDDHLKTQISDLIAFTNESKKSLIVASDAFTGYGRKYIKACGFNADAYIQMILQAVYYTMHNEFVPTYETALMRSYYNGRTETVRSCTVDAVNWVQTFLRKDETVENKVKALKQAERNHTKLMNEARNGKGFDRHLFGLWCAASEANLDMSNLIKDPLFNRSGGSGNFILSTSTLGYTINNGFVGPMCKDGYGVFYSMTNDVIWINVSVFRDNIKTSGYKFIATFERIMMEVKELIDQIAVAKL